MDAIKHIPTLRLCPIPKKMRIAVHSNHRQSAPADKISQHQKHPHTIHRQPINPNPDQKQHIIQTKPVPRIPPLQPIPPPTPTPVPVPPPHPHPHPAPVPPLPHHPSPLLYSLLQTAASPLQTHPPPSLPPSPPHPPPQHPLHLPSQHPASQHPVPRLHARYSGLGSGGVETGAGDV